MEDVLTYVIVFGLIIGGFAFWQFRYGKPRPYLLSHQVFPEFQLFLFIEKSEGKTKDFIIKIDQKKQIETKYPIVELIGKKRELEIIQLKDSIHNKNKSSKSLNNLSVEYKYSFNEFRNLLINSDFSFKSFRVSIENNSGRKFKSHELAFNKSWTIYRPDSGKYN